jgi:hypothetical protein
MAPNVQSSAAPGALATQWSDAALGAVGVQLQRLVRPEKLHLKVEAVLRVVHSSDSSNRYSHLGQGGYPAEIE